MEQKILTRQQFKEEEQKTQQKKENKSSIVTNLVSIDNGCWVNRPNGYNRSHNRL